MSRLTLMPIKSKQPSKIMKFVRPVILRSITITTWYQREKEKGSERDILIRNGLVNDRSVVVQYGLTSISKWSIWSRLWNQTIFC
jgi:hypothetical protein